jgi:inositol transporter-like SP family MFS transporter
LFQRRHVRALSFLIVMYGVWNLVAGTYGFFFPYILEAVGNTSERANYTLQAIWFLATALAEGTIYMPRIDHVSGRTMLLWASVLQVLGFVPFVLFEVSFLTALINVVLFGIGAGIGQQSLFQLWSGQMFPTLLRSTAQGFMFGVIRVALGGWSLLLPTVQQAGFRTLSVVLAGMLIVSGVVGIAFAPRGRTHELEEETEGSDRFSREPAGEPASA